MLATKEDLKEYVTKDEFRKTTDQILTAVDSVAKKLDTIKDELVSNQAAHDRFDDRITRTEKKLGLDSFSFARDGK